MKLVIEQVGAPVLRTVSTPVVTADAGIRALAENMIETMLEARGIGLAANQVGISQRLIVVAAAKPIILINPQLVELEGRQEYLEGCLSIPSVFAMVPRAERIVVDSWNLDGEFVRLHAGGLLARAIQHEIDHLDGILFLDHVPILRQYGGTVS